MKRKNQKALCNVPRYTLQRAFELRDGETYFTNSMIAVSAASPRRTPVRMMRV